jgi:hypothetical protein
MSEPAAFEIGQPFDPRFKACGIYPKNYVSRLGRFKIPASGRKFSHAHKRVYELLLALWGPNQKCIPRHEWLADELTISLRSIKMLVKDLETFGLIRHTLRRGRKKGGDYFENEYVFLWHPIFEVQDPDVLKGKNELFEVQILARLKCKNEPPLNKEDLDSERKSIEKLQHHRVEPVVHEKADDVAGVRASADAKAGSATDPRPSPEFLRSIEAASGFNLSPSDLAWCAALERNGADAETVCTGVLVGRARKLCSDQNRGGSDPIRSLRYFAACIEEAASGAFPAGYAEHMRNWLSRHGQDTTAPADEVPTPAARGSGGTDRKGMREAGVVLPIAVAAKASG